MARLAKALRVFGALALVLLLSGLVAAGAVYWYLAPTLPSTESLGDVRYQVPLRVYTRDEKLVAEFGEKRRIPLRLDQIPQVMIKAVLAAEDERFFEHPGVDWQGLTRAVVHLARTGEKGPGGSTITMQVARNFFLGREKTYTRKLNEILLALRIERELSKEEILELYFNKIFLGQRAYGVGAAAQVYYGRSIEDLDLAQIAMIAGLPKAPSRFNPIVNPERATARRNYVLDRMLALGFVTPEAHGAARGAPVSARIHGLAVELDAPYVAEMARAEIEQRFGEDAYTNGYRVYTTVDSRLQRAAVEALRSALIDYDRRHGYRGPEFRLDPPDSDPVQALADIPSIGGLLAAVVVAVDERSATLEVRGHGTVEVAWEGLSWARRHISENRLGAKPKTAGDVLAQGDVVRVQLTEDGWRLSQVPGIEGALVSIAPNDGAILALSGGFDFFRSKFNRATQAERQPGSSFKPFVYSAALEKGFTPASMINDAPVVFDDPSLEAAWRPENYSGKFFGPTRLREALYKSRNLVSIRLLRAIGVEYAVDYVQRFGFDPQRLPRNLSLALGSATLRPLELAAGYAVLANGGFRVEPYLLERVFNGDGRLEFEADPARVCGDCESRQPVAGPVEPVEPAAPAVAAAGDSVGSEPAGPAAPPPSRGRVARRVITAQNAWLMHSLLRDVVRRGTGRRALELGRKDLAGKTGTTNDQRDAWFSGFMPSVVTTAWVGFDQLKPLGRRETGGRAALPMWIDYMRVALDGVPEVFMEQPEGLVTVRIDPRTGHLASSDDPDAVFETFPSALVPSPVAEASARDGAVNGSVGGIPEKLF